MKRILFIIRDFKQGGIPRCLQSLLSMIDSSKYIVDLLCLYQDGPYKGTMQNCNVIPQIRSFAHLLTFSKGINPIKQPITTAYKVADKILRLFGFDLLDHCITNAGKRFGGGGYDVVIAYSEGIAAQIAAKIDCPNRIVWIHNDYSFECARGDQGTSFNYFNRIVCVSEATKRSFITKFPKYADRTIAIYNIINDKFIIQSAISRKVAEFSKGSFNIISIGRICYQKNFDIIPIIFTELPKEIQNRVKWYIIGSGPQNEVLQLKKQISAKGLTEKCILLGAKDNPYPYIKNADLFVLTSRYESYPTVINEALVLETPILSIDIPPAYEMLENNRIYPLAKLPEAISIEIVSPSITHWDGATLHNTRVMTQFYNLLEYKNNNTDFVYNKE